MKKKNIIQFSLEEIKATKRTNWQKFDSLDDKNIDTSEIPELDQEWFKTANIVLPQKKQAISFRVDKDVVQWFKSKGKGYQTLMNAVLKAYVNSQEEILHK